MNIPINWDWKYFYPTEQDPASSAHHFWFLIKITNVKLFSRRPTKYLLGFRCFTDVVTFQFENHKQVNVNKRILDSYPENYLSKRYCKENQSGHSSSIVPVETTSQLTEIVLKLIENFEQNQSLITENNFVELFHLIKYCFSRKNMDLLIRYTYYIKLCFYKVIHEKRMNFCINDLLDHDKYSFESIQHPTSYVEQYNTSRKDATNLILNSI